MVRLTGACAGMLAFSVAIIRGLSVGNSAEIILQRAIVALIVFCGIGLILGWMARHIIVEYALNREKEIMARFQEQAPEGGLESEVVPRPPGNSTPPESEPIGA
jgi:ACR3 family arsenite efflux pump ArsB